jgi:diguanylate cyclase (GGDEF)-like protein
MGSAGHAARRGPAPSQPQDAVTERVTSRRRLERLVSQALLDDRPYVLALLDVDHFRAFRNLHGALAGDVLVRMFGRRLEAVAQADDGKCLRLGADEFALLVPLPPNCAAIDAWAKPVLAASCHPVTYRERHLAFSATLGFVHLPQHALTAADAVRCAELAVARGKQMGGGMALPCIPAQLEEARGRDKLALDLPGAIAGGQIVPYYQPVVALMTGKITGMEVLARWKHPVHGTLQPSAFIGFAEEQGLCCALTHALIGQVHQDCKDWPSHWHFAFNTTPRDVLDVLSLIALRQEHGLDSIEPSRIELEVTETALMRDLIEARSLIDSFQPTGVKLALDDFGTGYSNFQQLRRIPFSRLKIDKSFITDMLDDPRGAACVQAIIDLAHHLGMTATAEGVEDGGVADRLMAMGCDHAQGYHFARPMPAAAVTSVLETPPAGRGGMPHAA